MKRNRWRHIKCMYMSARLLWSLLVVFQAMLVCAMATKLPRQTLSFAGVTHKLLISNIGRQKEALRGYRCDLKPSNLNSNLSSPKAMRLRHFTPFPQIKSILSMTEKSPRFNYVVFSQLEQIGIVQKAVLHLTTQFSQHTDSILADPRTSNHAAESLGSVFFTPT